MIVKYVFKKNVKLIYILIDYVFDGFFLVVLNEGVEINLINIYGVSKWVGEVVCLNENLNLIIIRILWVYSKFGNNFVKIM